MQVHFQGMSHSSYFQPINHAFVLFPNKNVGPTLVSFYRDQV